MDAVSSERPPLTPEFLARVIGAFSPSLGREANVQITLCRCEPHEAADAANRSIQGKERLHWLAGLAESLVENGYAVLDAWVRPPIGGTADRADRVLRVQILVGYVDDPLTTEEPS